MRGQGSQQAPANSPCCMPYVNSHATGACKDPERCPSNLRCSGARSRCFIRRVCPGARRRACRRSSIVFSAARHKLRGGRKQSLPPRPAQPCHWQGLKRPEAGSRGDSGSLSSAGATSSCEEHEPALLGRRPKRPRNPKKHSPNQRITGGGRERLPQHNTPASRKNISQGVVRFVVVVAGYAWRVGSWSSFPPWCVIRSCLNTPPPRPNAFPGALESPDTW